MAEENVPETLHTPAESIHNLVDIPAADGVLQCLADLVNISTLELPITLTCHGFLVSGTLISGLAFFKNLSDEFARQIPGDEEGNPIADYFLRFGDIYKDVEEDTKPKKPPIYIHLKDASFFHNSGRQMPANSPVWWRGRLAEVAGFHMGMLLRHDHND